MDGLSTFVTGFCSSCVLLGFLYMLSPDGNMKLSVKYVFCLCVVCCIISTVTTLKKLDFSFLSSTTEEEILTEQNAAVTSQMIFGEALRQQNINFRKIDVNTNKLGDNSIVINKVIVYTSDDASKIIQIIGSDNYEVCVINE